MRSAHTTYLSEFQREGVQHASALFYVVDGPACSTTIELLDYWRLKHDCCETTLRLRLRRLSGELVAEQSRALGDGRAHRIDVRGLCGAPAGVHFEGCLELDVFTARDIRFAYPAMLAVYRGPDSLSSVHTYTRRLSLGSGDSARMIDEVALAYESNWLIADDAEHEHFLVLHNGDQPVPAHEATITLTNHWGEETTVRVPVPTRGPGETVLVVPGEHLDVVGFLAGRPGWGAARCTVRGVFPRLLAVHRRCADGALVTMTHSHHHEREHGALIHLPDEAPARPLFISVPAGTPWVRDIRLMPTCPHVPGRLVARRTRRDGVLLDRVELTHTDRLTSVSSWLAAGPSEPHVADLALMPSSDIAPARVHVVVEIDGRGPVPVVFTTGLATWRKPRYRTYWWPILRLPGCRDLLALVHTDGEEVPGEAARLVLSLHRTSDGATATRVVELASNGALVGDVADLLPEAAALDDGGPLWIVARSTTPVNLHAFFMCINDVTGAVLADHAF